MRLCKKIGKYYITRNNPRELLLQIKELKDKVNILEHPAEQLIRIKGFQKEFDDTVNKLEASEKARKEAIEFLFIVYGISADYDGFNDAAGLKAVIDDIARYAKQAKKVLDIDKGEMKDE